MNLVAVGHEREQGIETQVAVGVRLDARRRRPHEVFEDGRGNAVVEEFVTILAVQPGGRFSDLTGEHGILLPRVEVVVTADKLVESSVVWSGHILEQQFARDAERHGTLARGDLLSQNFVEDGYPPRVPSTVSRSP